MNRRDFLKVKNLEQKAAHIPQAPKDPKPSPYRNKKGPKFQKAGGTLAAYTGPFGREQAKQLLYRTLFGYSKADLDYFSGLTLDGAISELLTPEAAPSPPVNSYYNQINDPVHAPGETWINGPISVEEVNFFQIRSFQNWWFGRVLNQGRSIHEKMTLFWHNHFATQANTIIYSQLLYRHHDLIRTNALGNFKQLTKDITIDAGMLIYLNGYKNQKGAPDENYARELQELFTLGKGPDSQYTESDVREAARLLTGWTIDANGDAIFVPSFHDTGDKTFSSFFNNTTISGGLDGEREIDDLLDMIFAQEEVSKFLARNLYRFFVYYVIDDEIEDDIIDPLATIIRNNNYDITPALEALFKSEHFFNSYAKGAIIKNPIDYYVGMHKLLETDFPDGSDVAELYSAWEYNNIFASVSQMQLSEPPNVAGWEAYWNGPAYHELWINSATLPFRNQLSDAIIFPPGLVYQGSTQFVDVLSYTENIPSAEDPNELIDYLVDLFHPYGLNANQKTELKSILLSGQTQDFYWTTAWVDYVNDKGNDTKKQIVFFRLFAFYKKIMNLAEFQLS